MISWSFPIDLPFIVTIFNESKREAIQLEAARDDIFSCLLDSHNIRLPASILQCTFMCLVPLNTSLVIKEEKPQTREEDTH